MYSKTCFCVCVSCFTLCMYMCMCESCSVLDVCPVHVYVPPHTHTPPQSGARSALASVTM